jgi:hypothetical protein
MMTMVSKKELENISSLLLQMGPKVSKEIGDNWFPCGRAWVRVSGTSETVRVFKKEGRKDRERYHIGILHATRDDYAGGYRIYIDYPAKNATESQSLNFYEPLALVLSKALCELGEKSSMETWID